jgi:hypothetical protein
LALLYLKNRQKWPTMRIKFVMIHQDRKLSQAPHLEDHERRESIGGGVQAAESWPPLNLLAQ